MLSGNTSRQNSNDRPNESPQVKPQPLTVTRRSKARPGNFDRTFGISEQRIRRGLTDALILAVDNSAKPPVDPTVLLFQSSSLAPSTTSHKWLSGLFDEDTLHRLFATEDMGNYVIVRRTGEREWESMPFYARIGMHLLFYGPSAVRFLTWSWIRKILKEQSNRQGKIYDAKDPRIVVPQIQSFIATYSISTSDLLERDIEKYPTFNSFFSRRLKLGARPPASPNNPKVISSAADSRLTVFNSVNEATTFWVKGRHFTIANLLQDAALTACLGESPCLAIWRLAPQDYHRFHSPVSGKLRQINHIPGEYYTVNPQAVNEDLDVFTANSRSVAILDVTLTSDTKTIIPVAFVAIGALLVGSIGWDKNPGDSVARGDNLGYFQYGGSTVIAVFPQIANIKWDEDLLSASRTSIEVLVRVGEQIGRTGVDF